MPEDKNNTNHYIDKNEFTTEMAEYSAECKIAKQIGKPRPQLSDSIGRKFVLIAEHQATWHKFNGYTFKEEMVGDAIEKMTRYAHNFNIELAGKSGAFSYFSRITWYAFVQRINKEEMQYRTKVKWVQAYAVLDMLPSNRQDHDHGETWQNEFAEYLFDYYDAEHQKIDKKKNHTKIVIQEKPKSSVAKAMTRKINGEKNER